MSYLEAEQPMDLLAAAKEPDQRKALENLHARATC